MSPEEAIDYIYNTYKDHFGNDTKLFDAIVIVKRELAESNANSYLRNFLLNTLVHYSEEVGKAIADKDETRRLVMASKQSAIFDVLAQKC